MKKKAITLLVISFTYLTFGQASERQKLIDLGKTYKDFMFRNEPPKDLMKEIKLDTTEI